MNRDELKLITKICYLYYYEEEVQSKIAKRFNLTRQMVSRLIQKAKDEGILQIIIESPLTEVIELESALESKFGLKEAIVIQNDTLSDEELIKKLGKAAGEYLNKILMHKLKIGIGFGMSIESMAEYMYKQRAMPSFEDVTYVQLAGGMNSFNSYDNSQFIMNLLAKNSKSHVACMNVPSIIDEEDVRKSFLQSKHYKYFLDAFNDLDYAFVQINGANRVYSSAEMELNASGRSYLKMLGINYLNSLDAIGEVCFSYFNDRGHFIESPIDESVIAISSKKIKAVKNLVGIVGGEEYHRAALGAVRTKAFDVIITDEDTARFMLEQS